MNADIVEVAVVSSREQRAIDPHRDAASGTETDRALDAFPDEPPSPGRLESFSDGVFAIIITLLVLDIHVPLVASLDNRTLVEALVQQWPMYVAYVLSFLQVGVIWSNHHAMFHHIRRTDHLLLVYNLLFLLCVALLPFTTALIAEYARAGEEQRRLTALIYSGDLVLSTLFFNAVWRHALRAGLVNPHADPNRLYALEQHWMLAPICYALAFVLAFVNARMSMAMYVILLLYYALPGPGVVRLVMGRRARRAAEGLGQGLK